MNSTCRNPGSTIAPPAAAAKKAPSWYCPSTPMLNRFILNPIAAATAET